VVVAELKIPETPKRVEMYDVNQDRMRPAIDSGWRIILLNLKTEGAMPAVEHRIKVNNDMWLIAIRDEEALPEGTQQ
jgi:hypothetical protein